MRWLSALVRRDRRMLSFAIIALGYLVMAQSLIQFLLARNVERRMDFAITGGVIGICLVLVGSVALLAESAHQCLQTEEQASLRLALRIRETLTRTDTAGPSLALVPESVACTDRSFHRADCLLIEHREDLVERPLAKAYQAQLSSCRLCLGELT